MLISRTHEKSCLLKFSLAALVCQRNTVRAVTKNRVFSIVYEYLNSIDDYDIPNYLTFTLLVVTELYLHVRYAFSVYCFKFLLD